MRVLFEERPRERSRGRTNTRRLTVLAFLVAIAVTVAYIESLFPPLMPIAPGAKLGLSNVAPLFALIVLGVPDAYIVMTFKCFLSALVTGGLSGLMYSVPAGLVSLSAETLLFVFVFDKMSIAGISLVGAIVFNCVQVFTACLITGVNLSALLPIMIAVGVAAGAFTGLLTYYTVKKLPYSLYGVR